MMWVSKLPNYDAYGLFCTDQITCCRHFDLLLPGSHDQFHFYIGITADTFSADLDF